MKKIAALGPALAVFAAGAVWGYFAGRGGVHLTENVKIVPDFEDWPFPSRAAKSEATKKG